MHLQRLCPMKKRNLLVQVALHTIIIIIYIIIIIVCNIYNNILHTIIYCNIYNNDNNYIIIIKLRY